MFETNNFSLSVPNPLFEDWLRRSALHDLNPAANGDVRRNSTEVTGSRAVSSSRSWLPRFQLPRIQLRIPNPELTWGDIVKEPLPWLEDFYGSKDSIPSAYSIPSLWDEACTRVEKNVVHYFGNYVQLGGTLLLCVLYKYPLALLGLLGVIAISDAMKWLSRPELQNQLLFQLIHWILYLASWVLILYCRIMPTLLYAFFLGIVAVLIHSLFRKPPARVDDKKRGRGRERR